MLIIFVFLNMCVYCKYFFYFCGFYFDSYKIYINYCVIKISEDEVFFIFVFLNNYLFL